MTGRHSLVLATTWLALSACHAQAPRTQDAAAGCPEKFASAKRDGDCDEPATCTFPEGTCSCARGSYCGGTPPSREIEEQNKRLRWVCENSPPAVRGDGCPGVAPHGACTDAGKQCKYDQGCCFVLSSCVDGKWNIGQPECPP